MHFEEMLRKKEYRELWDEYCGFLELSMDEYMKIQNRLLKEQLELWLSSNLGKQIMKGKSVSSFSEFKEIVPITNYNDYADVLLSRRSEDLPSKPITWIETTWEAGRHPVKCAPYSQEMLNTFKNNMLSCLVLAGSNERYDVTLRPHDKTLYGVASLPYATGLLPILVQEELTIDILPPVEKAEQLNFKDRNVLGFKMGLKQGIDVFFALSSVAYYVSMAFSQVDSMKTSSANKISSGNITPKMAYRLMKAKYRAKSENREILPKDIFDMKCFLCAGTDSVTYKPVLEKLWGKRPHEIFAGTEPTCIASENWRRNGLYFFPDACFYEFLPAQEAIKYRKNPEYKPSTFLMDEVICNEEYELIVTVLHGGAFVRYLSGDRYRCLATSSKEDKISLPRFAYLDRSLDIIDIAGFTRISEGTILDVITLSKLDITDWVALKEYDDFRPYLHLIVEMSEKSLCDEAISIKILKEHLQIYFTFFDNDYMDLQNMLGVDPLKITILRCGTFKEYELRYLSKLQRMNPPAHNVANLLSIQCARRRGK
ncbi:MAG: GH3 auxin-responsive promoter family protein [Erysipelotrichaceae bacterium]